MGNKVKIDKESLVLLCEKAAISLSLEEKDELLNQLNSIADLFDQIRNLTVAKADFTRHETFLQEDKATIFKNVEEMENNVPLKEGKFVLSPVINYQGVKK